jgi:uncharacterized protein YbjT (DUF2867 family)
MIKDKIIITGATGNTGSEVMKQLIEMNVNIVAAGTNQQKFKVKYGDIPFVRLDFTDESTYEKSLEGVNKIFLMRPPSISNVKKYIEPFIELASKKGVQHIVFLSLLGVENNKIVPHHKIEKAILKHDIPYTFLRAGFFMQNLTTTHREDIQRGNEICIPAGKGKTSFIDVRDIASVAVKALVEDGHLNRAYELTGKTALSYYEVADIMSEELGKDIKYQNPSIIKFFLKMRQKKYKITFILIMIVLYSVSKFGKASIVTNSIEQILGREPISMRQFIRDYKELLV